MWPKSATKNAADDADVAAGAAAANGYERHQSSDLEFYEDLISEPVLVLGVDISHLSRRAQFLCCAFGVFSFSLLYGYLQELISVQMCNRQLGLFLAMMQFIGYTLWSYLLRTYVYERHTAKTSQASTTLRMPRPEVPFLLYLGLSLLRAVDLGMTNMAMQYVNYPAKTLMKSSRVVFTVRLGATGKRKSHISPTLKPLLYSSSADAIRRPRGAQTVPASRLPRGPPHGSWLGHLYACRCQFFGRL